MTHPKDHMTQTPTFLLDQLRSEVVADCIQAPSDVSVTRQATVALGVVAAITLHPSGVTTWRSQAAFDRIDPAEVPH